MKIYLAIANIDGELDNLVASRSKQTVENWIEGYAEEIGAELEKSDDGDYYADNVDVTVREVTLI